MKQKILYIILMITAFLGRGEMVFGQTTYYVLEKQGEVQIMDGWSSSSPKTYTWDGPGATLTFQHKRGGAATKGLELVFYKSDGNTILFTSVKF